jgi:tRNA nucleotidyltransferase (CCA-adding enzyme)
MKVDAWFSDFLSAIRLTPTQVAELKNGHTLLTDRIKADEVLAPLLVSTFLQGSYRRATAVRPNGEKRADVDVIVVTNLREEDYPDPEKAMKLFAPLMERHYKGKYELQGRSIGINMSKVDLDVVPTSAPSEADEKVLKSESDALEMALRAFGAFPEPTEFALS